MDELRLGQNPRCQKLKQNTAPLARRIRPSPGRFETEKSQFGKMEQGKTGCQQGPRRFLRKQPGDLRKSGVAQTSRITRVRPPEGADATAGADNVGESKGQSGTGHPGEKTGTRTTITNEYSVRRQPRASLYRIRCDRGYHQNLLWK